MGSIRLELREWRSLRIRWLVGRAISCAFAVSGLIARDDERLLGYGVGRADALSSGEVYSALEIE